MDQNRNSILCGWTRLRGRDQGLGVIPTDHKQPCHCAGEVIERGLIGKRDCQPLPSSFIHIDTLRQSVQKTGRCLVAHEATRFCGYGAELVATVQQECFWHLEAPIERVAGWDTPYPHAFEWNYFPGQKRMVAGIRKVMEAG